MDVVAACRLSTRLISALGLLLMLAPQAAALEAIDGRFQAHGYYEMQLRTLSKNYGDQWDLSQWYNIFNLELEMDLIQDTHGPLDLMSAYVRIEARFDCIYSRGCGMIRGVDLYGNRARRMPKRLNSVVEHDSAGQIPLGEQEQYDWWTNDENDPLRIWEVPGFAGIYDSATEGLGEVKRQRDVACTLAAGCAETDPVTSFRPFNIPQRFWQADRNKRATVDGVNAVDDGTQGAPYKMVMDSFKDFGFGAIPGIGGSGGGHPVSLLGPWLPENEFALSGAMANQVNSMDSSRIVPQSLFPGGGANPMRPIPIYREDDPERSVIWINRDRNPDGSAAFFQGWETINPSADDIREYADRAAKPWEARGLFVPSPNLKKALQEGLYDSYPFRFSELERAFNRGASQQDEGELKEAYLDIELFDSRLWLRVGKQSIVWGKTELFRTTDQFNPQDFGLGNLPSLEESRIGLWAMRGVWSFYEVGPFQDVRVEGAFNFDEFESADLGACGEPYTFNAVCGLTFGSFAHGFTGIGVVGFEQPPTPWEDARGWEIGGRIEWRWDRFSFALMDFYGYDDFPHPVLLSTYSRNVDWRTGRPRHYMHGEDAMRLVGGGGNGCAAPFVTSGGKRVENGMYFDDLNASNPNLPYEPDLTDTGGVPSQTAARVGYTGKGHEGCLYPGPTNRQVRIIAPGLGHENYGVYFRATSDEPSPQSLWLKLQGSFLNDTTRADPNDPRPLYSSAEVADGVTPTGASDWRGGPNSHLCGTKEDPSARDAAYSAGDCPTVTVDPADYVEAGARSFNTQKYLADGRLNPSYNPYYDPRMDRYFDVSQSTSQTRHADPFKYAEDPGDIIPGDTDGDGDIDIVLYDPVLLNIPEGDTKARPRLWLNAYDPTLAYDERNALDNSPTNISVFNWICSTTVAFSELDPASCALTIFGSTRSATERADGTRIAYAISGMLSGNALMLSFLGDTPSDQFTSKGPGLPLHLAGPGVLLHADFSVGPQSGESLWTGRNTFRTRDARRHWADLAAPPHTSPFIYSRESESFNCVPFNGEQTPTAHQLCGGLYIDNSINNSDENPGNRFTVGEFVSRALTPEQEALVGCGPFYGTACDSNGMDLLNAEGSAILESFIGAESHGISFERLGIAALVPASFGSRLMDGGSGSREYRTDGRVIGSNGKLLRIDLDDNGTPDDPSDDTPLKPALGYEAGLREIGSRNSSFVGAGVDTRACNYSQLGRDSFVIAPGRSNWIGLGDERASYSAAHNRWNPRCWDNRKFYRAYGVQPGTATFQILKLGAPKCTTADIGGPLGEAGMLPGCRNKWDTILYSPGAGWDGLSELHPNNPDAGYIGNAWYGQRMGWKYDLMDVRAAPNPRTDARQWRSERVGDDVGDPSLCPGGVCEEQDVELSSVADLNTAGGPCEAYDANPSANYWKPANYDCRIMNPSEGLSGVGQMASVRWESSLSDSDPSNLAATASRRSGLNWGTYWTDYNGLAAANGASSIAQPEGCNGGRSDVDCYLGGWKQTVDGDPDRMGVASGFGLIFPKFRPDVRVLPAIYDYLTHNNLVFDNRLPNRKNRRDDFEQGVTLERVEGRATVPTSVRPNDLGDPGCTPANWAALIQRREVSSLGDPVGGRLIGVAECAHTFRSPRKETVLPGDAGLEGVKFGPSGAGHPFTGESFSSELAGLSFNLMMFLVAASGDFQDGLASVRAYVNPELYENRYIYDEPWMWDDGSVEGRDCRDVTSSHPNWVYCGRKSYADWYGDPNRTTVCDDDERGDDGHCVRVRVRQAVGVGVKFIGLGKGAFGEISKTRQINELPSGMVNKLQRDPSLRNILTDFPDLVLHECKKARNAGVADPNLCSSNDDWDAKAQKMRLGSGPTSAQGFGQGGLIKTLLWDYAFTGTENDFMANIPFCESLVFSQLHTRTSTDDTTGIKQNVYGPNRVDCTRGLQGEVLGHERCTFVTPQYCDIVQAIFSVAGQKRNVLRAGGGNGFGRRTMQWQSGGEIYLAYEKRNVLGFSTDFAEDYTKSNWSMEFTWIEGLPQFDNNSYDVTTKTDDFNLTVSVDRPTFINFLNPNRTLFINSQWFFRYRKDYNDGMLSNGPVNVLATLAVFTGYFQDRLNPRMVFVYDFMSSSGAALPEVGYRFSEAFSITVGASIFFGESQFVDMPVNGIAPASPRSGPHSYQDSFDGGLSLFRDRDEVFMTLRYTF